MDEPEGLDGLALLQLDERRAAHRRRARRHDGRLGRRDRRLLPLRRSSRISDCASIGTGVARTAGEYSVSAAELSESEPGGVVGWYDGEE